MSDDRYICITREPVQRLIVTSFPDLESFDPIEGIQDSMSYAETLCDRKRMKIMCFTFEQFSFYYGNGLETMICPRCMEHPDVALFLLSEL